MSSEPLPDIIAIQGQQRVFTAQLLSCLALGSLLFALFCLCRLRWPRLYATRLNRNASRHRPLPAGVWRWIPAVVNISDDDILLSAGLDAYVYVSFFKMAAAIFLVLALLALLVLAPVRFFASHKNNPSRLSGPWQLLHGYHWLYAVFTYLFSIIVYTAVYRFTVKVLRTRQKYLASMRSVVDRTFRLDNIPEKLTRNNDPAALKSFIESLGIGKVSDVKLLYDWRPLESLFDSRSRTKRRLERLYVSLNGMVLRAGTDASLPSAECGSPPPALTNEQAAIKSEIEELARQLVLTDAKIRDMQALFDSHALSPYDQEQFGPHALSADIRAQIDLHASSADGREQFSLHAPSAASRVPTSLLKPLLKPVPTSSAFVTMRSVASAQMAVQTLMDPHVYRFIATPAPSPRDVCWNSFRYSPAQKFLKSCLVTLTIGLSYLFVLFLVTPLTTLLDLKTLQKSWPALGHLVAKSKWATTLITGILPPLLYSAINLCMPYFYQYLSQHQGHSCNSKVELSTLSKNFAFTFFTLFLAFTVSGTFWDYVAYIGDTTKIAYQLARSLGKLSLFYVDLILLQGLVLFPLNLLQVGNVLIFHLASRMGPPQTPRDYRTFYLVPQEFNFGMHLPQHLLIFMIVLIYSVTLLKIVICGVVYFAVGWFVYKYQLMYSFVHPPHSTAKVWPVIVRRIALGLVIFQLFMCGTLALESSTSIAIACAPLVFVSMTLLYHFQTYYTPLNLFIALHAIIHPNNFDDYFDQEYLLGHRDQASADDHSNAYANEPTDFSESTALLAPLSSTFQEDTTVLDYTNPLLRDPLHGPWIGFDGDEILVVDYYAQNDFEASISEPRVNRIRPRLSEWE